MSISVRLRKGFVMRYMKRAIAVFLAGVLCWTPVMGPLSAYAETVVYDAPASAGVSEGAAADAVEEDASASDVPDADGVAADASPVDQDSAHDAEIGAEAANTPEPADEAPDGAGVNGDAAEADAVEADAHDGTGSTSNSADMANSWRFQDGALRTDIESGISLFSADGLPSGATARGIDVSQWNGAIDWAAVKEAGIDFAILRLGYGSAGTDTQFAANVKGCQENDIPFGVYATHGMRRALVPRRRGRCSV